MKTGLLLGLGMSMNAFTYGMLLHSLVGTSVHFLEPSNVLWKASLVDQVNTVPHPRLSTYQGLD